MSKKDVKPEMDHCKNHYISGIPVEVKDSDHSCSLMVYEKESILDALMKADASYSAVCGGTGRCGKCRIKLLEGNLPVTESDKQHFTDSELESGFRLACRAYPEESIKVELLFYREDDFEVVTEYAQNRTTSMRKQEGSFGTAVDIGTTTQDGIYGIAIDIGTTTIAMQLVSLSSGEIAGTYTALNRQRRFGADVIARIEASAKGHQEELRELIREDLKKGIHSLVREAGIFTDTVTKLAIAGNTTMIHLLMGYDCNGLGSYPFTPVNIKLIESTYEDVLGDTFLHAKVNILPGVSVFVGGDIVSGL